MDIISASSRGENGQIPVSECAENVFITLCCEVEMSKGIVPVRVPPYLDVDDVGPIGFKQGRDNRIKSVNIDIIISALEKGDVHIVAVSFPDAQLVFGAPPWIQGLSRFMKGYGQNAIVSVKGVLDAVAVMRVNVDVSYFSLILNDLCYGQGNIIYVAEAFGIVTARVMEPAMRIECDAGLVVHQKTCPFAGPPCCCQCIVIHARDNRVVRIADSRLEHFEIEFTFIALLQQFNVVRAVEGGE